MLYNYYHLRSHFLSISLIYLILSFVYTHASVLLLALFCINYAHLATINFTCIVTFVRMVFLKFDQLAPVLVRIERHFCPQEYWFYRREYVRNLVFFLKFNQMYGHTFVAYLLVFCPTNVEP